MAQKPVIGINTDFFEAADRRPAYSVTCAGYYDCIEAAGGVAQIYMHMAYANSQKQALRANVEEARSQRVYGAPSFIVDGELFWGDDRLEDALEWAQRV